jgi:hypothetical protein
MSITSAHTHFDAAIEARGHCRDEWKQLYGSNDGSLKVMVMRAMLLSERKLAQEDVRAHNLGPCVQGSSMPRSTSAAIIFLACGATRTLDE